MAQMFFIPCSKTLGQHNAKPSRNSVDPAKYQKRDRSCSSYRRQCIYAQKPAYNHGIHQIVKILEQIPNQNRKRKQHNQPQRISLGHIILHVFSFLLIFFPCPVIFLFSAQRYYKPEFSLCLLQTAAPDLPAIPVFSLLC